MADPLVAAATSLIGRLTGDLIKSAWSAIETEIEVFYTPAKIRSLSKKLAAIETVKPLRTQIKHAEYQAFTWRRDLERLTITNLLQEQ